MRSVAPILLQLCLGRAAHVSVIIPVVRQTELRGVLRLESFNLHGGVIVGRRAEQSPD
jgi:hypothetical protein